MTFLRESTTRRQQSKDMCAGPICFAMPPNTQTYIACEGGQSTPASVSKSKHEGDSTGRSVIHRYESARPTKPPFKLNSLRM